MARSVNVKKTKSSKKIILKITMSMTCLLSKDTLQLASDPINNSSQHPHDVSRYVAPFSAAPGPFNTRVTKIGLIDPDDLTKEDTRHTCGTHYHLLHHRRKGIAEVTRQIAFGSSRLA